MPEARSSSCWMGPPREPSYVEWCVVCCLFFSALELTSRAAPDIAWMKTLDDKAPLLINRDELDPRDFGGDSYDEYGRPFRLVSRGKD